MEKIIAAFDGLKYSTSTTDYAVSIAKQNQSHLVGVFLDDLIYHSYRFSDVIENGKVSDKKLKALNEKDAVTRNKAIELFKASCKKAGVEFSVHHDRNVAVKELIQESIYSDMLIVGKKENFNLHHNKFPSDFLQEVLADVQCPVMVVPEKYTAIKSVIFLYDGDPSSVFAVKVFNHDFESFKKLPAKVLSVKAQQSSEVAESLLMKEFMKRYLPKAKNVVLKGEAENKILSYLKEQPADTLVVLGAYRRGRVLRWFRQSMADVLMVNTELPLYIAHNR